MSSDILKIATNTLSKNSPFCPGSAQNGPPTRIIWDGGASHSNINNFNVSYLIIVAIQDRYIYFKIIQEVVLKLKQITFCNEHVLQI